jgi:hypothetical protein
LPGLAVGQQLGVAVRFPARHPRPVAELQAAQPFDVEIALEPRHEQPDRKAVSRPQRFATALERGIEKEKVWVEASDDD